MSLSPKHYPASRELCSALEFFRLKPKYKSAIDLWNQQCTEQFTDFLLKVQKSKFANSVRPNGPSVFAGPIASGSVSKSQHYRSAIQGVDRKMLAIETEAGGVLSKASEHNIPAICIRGISDLADKEKNAFEHATGGQARQYAARNAISFLHAAISSPDVCHFLNTRREPGAHQLSLGNGLQNYDINHDQNAIKELEKEITSQLADICIEFKLTEKGYKLPVPRVRHLPQLIENEKSLHSTQPIEFTEAITRFDHIFLDIPPFYPDNSLSWRLAHAVLAEERNGMVFLPIVIDGRDIKPPRQSFTAKLASFGICIDQLSDLMKIVFIVENFSFHNERHNKHLQDLMLQIDNVKFVFLAEYTTRLLSGQLFIEQNNVEIFELCPISFSSIAHFLNINFAMNQVEADVAAAKLCRLFSEIDLDVHPSYFAGLPRELLVSLLQANKRAELIQLAVDGYLLLLVADDSAHLTLSRSTRLRFLRTLARAICVEKRRFSLDDVVEFSAAFAKRHDFDIDPTQFVNSFFEIGILFLDDRVVSFARSFIEKYVLALELKDDVECAKRYFGGPLNDFDHHAFDIYAEIGPSNEIVNDRIFQLKKAVETLGRSASNVHTLEDTTFSPRMLSQPAKIGAVRANLQQNVDSLRGNPEQREKKQMMIDIAQRVQEEARKAASDHTEGTDTEGEKDENSVSLGSDDLNNLCKQWLASTQLLGSGGEFLEAAEKRELANLLLEAASILVDGWARQYREVDFEKVEALLIESAEEFLEKRSNHDAKFDIEDIRKAIGQISELMEYLFLSRPLTRVLEFLAHNARSKVLISSIRSVDPEHKITKMIQTAWLSEIDAAIFAKEIKHLTAVRLKSEQFQLVGYLRSKGFGFVHRKGLI